MLIIKVEDDSKCALNVFKNNINPRIKRPTKTRIPKLKSLFKQINPRLDPWNSLAKLTFVE